jgi:hypothetical protein
VREERLKTTSGLKGPGLRLSSWRGRSGRRYVVGIHGLGEADLAERLTETEAVVLAVRRDAAGTASLVAASSGATPREVLGQRFLRRAGASGATEVHVHRLAETPAERRAILADLGCAGEA